MPRKNVTSITLIAMSIATYAYFVPTMLSMMHRADTYTPEQLSRTLSLWVNLSWLRSLVAVPAWLAAVKALTLLGGRPGWRQIEDGRGEMNDRRPPTRKRQALDAAI